MVFGLGMAKKRCLGQKVDAWKTLHLDFVTPRVTKSRGPGRYVLKNHLLGQDKSRECELSLVNTSKYLTNHPLNKSNKMAAIVESSGQLVGQSRQ